MNVFLTLCIISTLVAPWDRGRPARMPPESNLSQDVQAERLRSQADANKFAVIINGAGGEPVYAKQFEQWTTELQAALSNRYNFGERQLTVLPHATAEDVKRTFSQLKS